jgi:uncharacterized protein (DUF2249 family)
MVVNADTKIGAILKASPEALEKIVSLSPKFEKLRNPILRKMMAGRVSIGMAATIGGVKVEDFFEALTTLGFELKEIRHEKRDQKALMPAFLEQLIPEDIQELDVRPVLASGIDPLKIILGRVKELKHGQVLKIINTFEPTPLIHLLKEKGFMAYVDVINPDHIETWFYKQKSEGLGGSLPECDMTQGWEDVLKRYEGMLKYVDVRDLQMPLPMMTILEAIDKLSSRNALYVYHKRIPVFLLPELKSRNMEYRTKVISDNEVHLLIFHP